jgi:short-subunit dehydrogenase
MDLTDKRIVLTGAASGIGLALLERLAGLPVQLLATDMNGEALETACANVRRTSEVRRTSGNARIIPYTCDLSCAEAVDRLFEKAASVLGSIDVFIANAGFAYYEQVEAPDWIHLENIFRVNVFNSIYTLEKMQALYGDRSYKVVITASAMAHIAVPGYAIYSATKAALDRFADGYRWQMPDPSRLMLVYPIGTRTGFFRAAGQDVPIPWPTQTPQAVARAVLDGIRHDRSTVYPSGTFRLVLFLDRFLPMHWLVQKIEQGRMKKWLEKMK